MPKALTGRRQLNPLGVVRPRYEEDATLVLFLYGGQWRRVVHTLPQGGDLLYSFQ